MNFHGINPPAPFGMKRVPRPVPVSVVRPGGGGTSPTTGQIWPRGSKA